MLRLLIRRAGAYVVDIVLLFAVLFPIGQLLRFVIGWPSASATGLEIWLVSALNFSLPTWIYFALSDSSAHGATAGKRWIGLRVSRVAGGSVGKARALARTAVPDANVRELLFQCIQKLHIANGARRFADRLGHALGPFVAIAGAPLDR